MQFYFLKNPNFALGLQNIKTYLLLALLCFGIPCIAQEIVVDSSLLSSPTAKPLNYDTNYIHRFGDVIAIEPWISAPSFEFSLEPKIDSLSYKRNNYQPHLRDVVGFDISYRAFTVSIGFKGRVIEEDEPVYGKTNYSIIKIRLNSKPFVYEFYHNTFSGFADYNTSAYDKNRPQSTPFVKRRDIAVQYTKLKAIYIFSKNKFSYGAAYSFTERQKKTKATALAVAHVYRMRTNADSAFFNNGQQGLFSKYDSLKRLQVYSIGLGPGFAVTFVEKRWFFSIGAYIMADLQYHTSNNTNNRIISEGWRGALLGDVFVSAGYNANWFYAGIVARGDRNFVSLPNVNTSTSFYSTVLSIGFRFNPPKIIPKLYDASPLRYL